MAVLLSYVREHKTGAEGILSKPLLARNASQITESDTACLLYTSDAADE